MSEQQWQEVAEAFSRKADVYDAFGEGHTNLTRMRRQVYDHLSSLAPPDSFLLELNAGTGLDAVEMVRRGYRVQATDIAPGMISQIETKIRQRHLAGKLSAQLCSFTELEKVPHRSFDGVYSNFGGLNCVADLTAVTRQLPHLLKPGGFVCWVIMPHICPWELARVFKDFKVATRRLHRKPIVATVADVQFMTTYYSARQVRLAFDPRFRQVGLVGLSLLTPPADNDTFAQKYPRLFHWLVRLDERLGTVPPFNGWGDFFIITLRFEP